MFRRAREGGDRRLLPRQEVVLNDLLAIRSVGELEVEDLSVLLGLLQPVGRRYVPGLRLHHRRGHRG